MWDRRGTMSGGSTGSRGDVRYNKQPITQPFPPCERPGDARYIQRGVRFSELERAEGRKPEPGPPPGSRVWVPPVGSRARWFVFTAALKVHTSHFFGLVRTKQGRCEHALPLLSLRTGLVIVTPLLLLTLLLLLLLTISVAQGTSKRLLARFFLFYLSSVNHT